LQRCWRQQQIQELRIVRNLDIMRSFAHTQNLMQVANVWSYARRDDGSRVEQAVWRGDTSPSLAAHFHNEIQITLVLAGAQLFLTPIGPMAVQAGETVVIGPAVPHEPLGLDALGTVSLNLYVQLTDDVMVARGIHVLTTPRWLQRGERMDRGKLAAWAADQISSKISMTCSREGAALADFVAKTDLEIGAVARLVGITREGFTRRFCRLVGLTPHAYRIAARLNAARVLLASDVNPAEAAADAGFADQSHLGRAFRSYFGTTPNVYRRAMR
jgi:AraC-like DNA-binding protein/quercetin dioxygenase-like cupin family protein